jgi:hypothetical protein
MSEEATAYCSDIYSQNPVVLFQRPVGGAIAAVGFVYLFMALLNIYWIKRQERKAKEGSHTAVKSVIFPVFVLVLWANACVNIYVGMVALTMTFNFFDYEDGGSNDSMGPIFAFSVMWGLQHCVTEGIAFLLMRKGLGWNTAAKAMRSVLIWGLVTFLCQLFVYMSLKSEPLWSLGVNLVWQAVLLFFYAALWLVPSKRLFRRPSVIIYARFWTLFRLLSIATTLLVYFPETTGPANCIYCYGLLLTFALFEPLVVYVTLLRDSKWWQGLDINEGEDPNVEAIR